LIDQKRKKRRRRRRLIGAGLAVLALGLAAVGAFVFKGDDQSVSDGFAAGRALTGEPAAESADELARQNAALKKKLAKEKRAAERAGGSGTSGHAPASFSKLEKSIGGPVGVSYGPVGSSEQTTLGDWSGGVAWSTAKVPVAVALARANGGTVTSSMRSAITASDNAGAEAMWSALGSGSRAGAKVDRVLSDAGDSTRIETQRVRDGYTPFGQTEWSLAAQQQFAAHLPCISGSDPVLALMGQIVPGQSFGLGSIDGSAKFKGGWGPGPGGGYLVRQFGIVEIDGGKLAVAIASEPSDGSFETGKANLSKLADWISSNLSGTRASSC
jgi:hypothetical protein